MSFELFSFCYSTLKIRLWQDLVFKSEFVPVSSIVLRIDSLFKKYITCEYSISRQSVPSSPIDFLISMKIYNGEKRSHQWLLNLRRSYEVYIGTLLLPDGPVSSTLLYGQWPIDCSYKKISPLKNCMSLVLCQPLILRFTFQ